MTKKLIIKSTLYFCLGTVISLGVLYYLISRQVASVIENDQSQFIAILNKEVGFPVKYQNIAVTWRWGIAIQINDITIFDQDVPFVSVEKALFFPNLKSLVFEKKVDIKGVELIGSTIVLSYKEKVISLLGLKEESIPDTVDYSSIIETIKNTHAIKLKNANLKWILNGRKIEQNFSGELLWLGKPRVDWILKGTHQIKSASGEGVKGSIQLTAAPGANTLILSTQLLDIGVALEFAKKNNEWFVNGEVNGTQLYVSSMIKELGDLLDHPGLHWASESLTHGIITNGSVRFVGPLDSVKMTGKIEYKNVRFNYHSKWPMIEHASGTIHWTNEQMNVELYHGQLGKIPIKQVSSTINYPEESPLDIYVKGNLHTTLEKGLYFINSSPLSVSVGKYFETLYPVGDMGLDLQLNIPLGSEIKVKGKISTQDAKLVSADQLFTIDNIQGDFNFTENQVEAKDISLSIFNEPMVCFVNTYKKGSESLLRVVASGILDINTLQSRLRFSIDNFVKGSTPFMLVASLDNRNPKNNSWTVESDLKGVEIMLPKPFYKNASEEWNFVLKFDPDNFNQYEIVNKGFFNIKMHTDNVEGHMVFKGAHIKLGDKIASWDYHNKILVDGEVSEINVKDYLSLASIISKTGVINQCSMNIDLLAKNLNMYGLEFQNIRVQHSDIHNFKKWVFDGNQLNGDVTFLPKDKISIGLKSLSIKEIPKMVVVENLLGTNRPSVSFECEKFTFKNTFMGEVKFKLISMPNQYVLNDFFIESSLYHITADGQWKFGEKPQTFLKGKIISTEVQDVFSKLGYPKLLSDAGGVIQFDVQWDAPLIDFKQDIIKGTVQIKLDKGIILGINPGIGRVIGLLNLDSIMRRLQLDFSDVLKKGLAFDVLQGKLDFNKGIVQSDKVVIDAPSAKFVISGKTILDDKSIDLKMTVTPHISVGLPLAAAIAAGNPAVGAGVWLLDKVVGSKINKISDYRYQINGTWRDPIITPIKDNKR